MNLTDIELRKPDGYTVAVFNRPDKLNALRETTRLELLHILRDFRKDSRSNALVLTGAGRAFSSGVDLEELDFSREQPFNEAEKRKELELFQEITSAIINLEKPVIAAINGIAVGAGLEIALACDIRIAAAEARFSFAEVRRGLCQTNGVMYILPRLIGFGRAMEILLTGRTLTGPEALALGLITRLVPPGALEEEMAELAAGLAENAPISLRLIKQMGWKSLDGALPEVMDLEVEGMLQCLRSEDMWEGIRAFLEKRKPVFTNR